MTLLRITLLAVIGIFGSIIGEAASAQDIFGDFGEEEPLAVVRFQTPDTVYKPAFNVGVEAALNVRPNAVFVIAGGHVPDNTFWQRVISWHVEDTAAWLRNEYGLPTASVRVVSGADARTPRAELRLYVR